jgi:hypothetical protein
MRRDAMNDQEFWDMKAQPLIERIEKLEVEILVLKAKLDPDGDPSDGFDLEGREDA